MRMLIVLFYVVIFWLAMSLKPPFPWDKLPCPPAPVLEPLQGPQWTTGSNNVAIGKYDASEGHQW